MAFRRYLRGRVSEPTRHRIAREVVRRHGLDSNPESDGDIDVYPLEVDNWLSTPCVVADTYFVKIITPQNAFVHGMLTRGRNIGVFSSGTPGFFEHVETPLEMVEHELEATRRMRELDLNVPEPLEAFEFEDLGILVLEYLPEFLPLHRVPTETVEKLAPALFEVLATMHEADLVHGDLRAENVLVAEGELYVIDATKVSRSAIGDASAYDLACALGTLEPIIGAKAALAAADEAYDAEHVLAAEAYLDFVNIRPDHDFEAATLKGEIQKLVA